MKSPAAQRRATKVSPMAKVKRKKSYEELAAWGEQYRLWWQTAELTNKALKREILELKSMFGAVQAIAEKFGKASERDFDDDIPF